MIAEYIHRTCYCILYTAYCSGSRISKFVCKYTIYVTPHLSPTIHWSSNFNVLAAISLSSIFIPFCPFMFVTSASFFGSILLLVCLHYKWLSWTFLCHSLSLPIVHLLYKPHNWNPKMGTQIFLLVRKSQICKFLGSFRNRKFANFWGVPVRKSSTAPSKL